MVEDNSTETSENIVASFKVRKNQPDFWYGILNELEVGEKKPNRPNLEQFYRKKKLLNINSKKEHQTSEYNNQLTNDNFKKTNDKQM